MVKSARRRNAKKTVGRKKRGTKGYRRKTMRGGVREEDSATTSYLSKLQNIQRVEPTTTTLASIPVLPPITKIRRDDDAISIVSGGSSAVSSAGSKRSQSFMDTGGVESGSWSKNFVEYKIDENNDNWIVTLYLDGTKEKYIVKKTIGDQIPAPEITPLG